ncbi:MAG: hypothetical protein ISR82_04105 [Candidatus Marinimicrobia bacterium]|nr:hypothetical protein [Candidatus Neomarinimicrobiota bacterium]MBL7010385.1 hypothetical protein [Candidatus Neomarinimicrobiota bacterium]MBL7030854.1 hypothetical protein [Candidatus Neomarinimicrobiota bacterium]
MATREFYKLSDEHAGIKSGMVFKTVKIHHEVQGDLNEDVELTLDRIIHFPTRYLMVDAGGRSWTVPVHSVEMIKE